MLCQRHLPWDPRAPHGKPSPASTACAAHEALKLLKPLCPPSTTNPHASCTLPHDFCLALGVSGDTNPCRMIGVTLHSHVRCKEISRGLGLRVSRGIDPLSSFFLAIKSLASRELSDFADELIWHISDSQGKVLSLAFRAKSLRPVTGFQTFHVVPASLESGYRGIPLIRNSFPVGPYSSPMLGGLW